ncbi:conserved hypothetical protein [Uncinocarpus reesii 1704]|uniref:Uncharacterized protein n=1 Tax=Uncinocarpus reesii (strain UAMH 1704) TaxID=336963 RepID=C4JH50_UNCRE|nr:uncharacterized protein UREG_02623 [Uncinocarpus reesii 1704]EEP77774.1 conserved hypothetical protein [Uncinocarpus reesii 1704]
MTPPPSQNVPHVSTPFQPRSKSNSFLASPPATVNQTLCVAYGASESLPSSTEIDDANDETLRSMAKELLMVAQESRMSAAHFKLQHSLLSLTSSEAIKRAEVEQQLAKRQIEILQSMEYRSRQTQLQQPSPQPQRNAELDAAMRRIQELEQAKGTLERRLRRAKKVIEEDADKYELLMEENARLKKRIRENREHFTLMMDHGSVASSPRTEFNTPQRRAVPRYPDSARSHVSRVGSHDPFAALLAADQVLNGESATIKSPPSKRHNHKFQGHTRGTHSLSSLPTTPQRKPVGSERIHFFTPINKRSTGPPSRRSAFENNGRDRHDRDSTISASDVEEALTDEDVPASQASSLATSMLRRFPGTTQEEPSIPANIGKSSTLLQAKLFGHVKKVGVDRPKDNLKRKRSIEEKVISPKKFRSADPVYVNMES